MSMKTTFLALWGIVASLGLILGCSPSEIDEESIHDPAETGSFTVQIVTIKEVPFRREEIIESFLYANKDAFILAKIDGMLKEVYVDLGDEISQGDTLAKIEDDLLNLEFELAQNSFNQVRHDFERSQILYSKNLISDSEYEKMKLKCEQADIEQRLALERLKQSRLIAPFSGVIVSNWARIGQMVAAGDTLFHLTEVFPIYTRVFLDEEELTRLKSAGKVRIEPKYGAQKSALGKIIKKSTIVDPASGTAELVIRIDARYTFLKPGMTVNVFLEPKVPSMILGVSKAAFSGLRGLSSRDTTSIYLYRSGRAIRRVVQLEEDLDSLWQIAGEFRAGDSIIVFSHADLRDGQKVKLTHTNSSDRR